MRRVTTTTTTTTTPRHQATDALNRFKRVGSGSDPPSSTSLNTSNPSQSHVGLTPKTAGAG
ncbi:hypothetical protein E2C01_007999 [Portunus trituberculatus]|uniref:Uncharacterized protein n=1 Tax=Portunus trituberculatus TaxID=210409 RepID=A0A5B7D2R7_PORTR|nr:hypothetical protein [Portunus trituberculatus]